MILSHFLGANYVYTQRYMQKSNRTKNDKVKSKVVISQGRRRIFKSGPAEEVIECRRHEMGESTRGGHSPSR